MTPHNLTPFYVWICDQWRKETGKNRDPTTQEMMQYFEHNRVRMMNRAIKHRRIALDKRFYRKRKRKGKPQ